MKKIDLKTKKNIIFDMDGTLVDSSILIANTINFVRKEFNLPILENTILLEAVNDPEIDAPKFFYEVDNYTQKHIDLFEKYYSENLQNDLVLYNGVMELLSELKEKNYKIFISTNASTKFAKMMLSHLKVIQFFDEVVGVEPDKKAKPEPDMLNYIVKKHELNITKTVMIGDSQKDIIASDRAEIESILVQWGFSNYSDKYFNNSQIITSFEELSF
jgi:phosphoglycolate phosphatase